jgi:osmotically-inducible protein OsmY
MTWRTTITSLGLALGATGLFVGTVAAAALDDAQVKARIEARLAEAGFHQPAEVQVEMRDGKAVLSGYVTTVRDQWTAERAARKVTKGFEDDIEVRPIKAVPDAALGKAIERAVTGYAYYGVFDAVGYSVDDGKVLLTGSVYQPYHKSDIEDRVARIAGVRAIKSTIEVQPLSPFDQRLRLQAYRLIYGNDNFVRYSIMADPPIRIIVTNGHLTLMGVVNNSLEKNLLTHLAGQVLSFGPVRNEVQVESRTATKTSRSAGIVV